MFRPLLFMVAVLNVTLSAASASPQNAQDDLSPPAAAKVDVFAEAAGVGEDTVTFEGKATWYGKGFQGRETTSGQKYDMHGMTAAHKTLPFGTYVRVTNPRNGKQVVVRINDRGPFAKDVIIDLSYAAAQKLDIVHDGPVPVQLTVLGKRVKREGQEPVYLSVDTDAGSFIILLKICDDMPAARALADKLKADGEFSSIKRLTRKNGTRFRVFAGPYGSLKKAEEAKARLEVEGFKNSYVVAEF